MPLGEDEFEPLRLEASAREPGGALPRGRRRPPAAGFPEPPRVVTFLMTDIEGSTRRWEEAPEAMERALVRHDRIAARAVRAHGGTVVKSRGEGDSVFAVFKAAGDAIRAALALQRDLLAEPWTTSSPIRVRAAVHTGMAHPRARDYFGTEVNRCARLRAIAHGGQTLVSLAARDSVHDAPPDGATLVDLGFHTLRDLVRPEHVFQLTHPDLPIDTRPLASSDAHRTNIPEPVTSFVGREHDLGQLHSLLEDARLVTLVGPGGAGKTRLATEVGTTLLRTFSDGVWLAEMALVRDVERVPRAVAEALTIPESPTQSDTEALVAHLRNKHMLLVLDNCEHLAQASADLVAAVLQGCRDLRILATSRTPLRLSAEVLYAVPRLPTPPSRTSPGPADLDAYPATALFLARSRAVKGNLVIDAASAPLVADICERLDGLPLAIELAAARTRHVPLTALRNQLHHRLTVLAEGPRDLPVRHQAMRDTIQWSYDLLEPSARVLFRRLSVFAGGWTFECGQQVCEVGVGGGDFGVGLSELVDASLVDFVDAIGSRPRYHMREVIREFAFDHLTPEEAEVVQRRHAGWCMTAAEECDRGLRGTEPELWRDPLAAELDNIRAALRWSIDHTETDVALRLSAALWWFWRQHGDFSEGRSWMDATLAMPVESPGDARARALQGVGWLALQQGDYGAVRAYSAELLVLGHRHDDELNTRNALTLQGMVALAVGSVPESVALFEMSLRISRELGGFTLPHSVLNVGISLLHAGDSARAAEFLDEAISLFVAAGDRNFTARSTAYRGYAALLRGDLRGAESLMATSLVKFRDLDEDWGVAEGLEGMSAVCAVASQGDRAARLAGAAEQLRSKLATRALPSDRALVARCLGGAREQIGEPIWAAAQEEGRAMSLAAAIDEALGQRLSTLGDAG